VKKVTNYLKKNGRCNKATRIHKARSADLPLPTGSIRTVVLASIAQNSKAEQRIFFMLFLR